MKLTNRVLCLATVLALWAVPGFGQSDGLDQGANDLFATGYPTPGASQRLNNELLFQSAGGFHTGGVLRPSPVIFLLLRIEARPHKPWGAIDLHGFHVGPFLRWLALPRLRP
jgi:hypothetical protein